MHKQIWIFIIGLIKSEIWEITLKKAKNHGSQKEPIPPQKLQLGISVRISQILMSTNLPQIVKSVIFDCLTNICHISHFAVHAIFSSCPLKALGDFIKGQHQKSYYNYNYTMIYNLYTLDRFTKTSFWNFQNSRTVLWYILIDKQMLH